VAVEWAGGGGCLFAFLEVPPEARCTPKFGTNHFTCLYFQCGYGIFSRDGHTRMSIYGSGQPHVPKSHPEQLSLLTLHASHLGVPNQSLQHPVRHLQMSP